MTDAASSGAVPAETALYYGANSLSALLYDYIETGLIADGVSPCCGDAAFYLDLAGRFPGPTLELGTGSGRIAWALAAAGHETVGVDLSPTMLRLSAVRGREYDAATAARLTFVEQDATRLKLGRRFGLILATYRTFSHLTDAAAQRRALTAAAAHLAPGGRMALHLVAPPDAAGRASPRVMRGRISPAGHQAEWRVLDHGADAARQTFFTTVRYAVFDPDGAELRSSVEKLVYRWVRPEEADALFRSVGLETVAGLDRFPGAPDGAVRDQIWLLRRRGEG